MSNPSRRTGTDYENRVLGRLRNVYGSHIERSSAGTPSRDFTGTPFPVEAKKRKTLAVPDWVRKIRAVSPGNAWAIFCCSRDLRSKDGFGELMIVDADFGFELLALAKATDPEMVPVISEWALR